ncbi:type I restriction endonuclease subunit R [Gardnerella vaginalis]|uniref:type I restriction endonuclease subunit R n=1 Tax=Gardnerella vaginalis TaxID=2702 RepID=UPI0039F04672
MVLLKKHKYPPEGMDDAVATVMLQFDLWVDNNDMEHRVVNYSEVLKESNNQELIMVAEDRGVYDNNECWYS